MRIRHLHLLIPLAAFMTLMGSNYAYYTDRQEVVGKLKTGELHMIFDEEVPLSVGITDCQTGEYMEVLGEAEFQVEYEEDGRRLEAEILVPMSLEELAESDGLLTFRYLICPGQESAVPWVDNWEADLTGEAGEEVMLMEDDTGAYLMGDVYQMTVMDEETIMASVCIRFQEWEELAEEGTFCLSLPVKLHYKYWTDSLDTRVQIPLIPPASPSNATG